VSAIEEMLEQVRRGFGRVNPAELSDEVALGALVIDIRPDPYRLAEGELPRAVVLERNVLEWRLDPTSPDRIDQAIDHDVRVIVVCNDGYASSLAVETLRRLGLTRATDLDGGYRAWRRFSEGLERSQALEK
jgi:rhodanese-related sulfurtransferase